MQIAPQYRTSFKELSKVYVDTDDRGLKYSLIEFEGKGSNRNVIKRNDKIYRWHFEGSGVEVLCDKIDRYSNEATGRKSSLFWKTKTPRLKELKVGDYILKEKEEGQHCMFWVYPENKEYGMRTKFKIYKNGKEVENKHSSFLVEDK